MDSTAPKKQMARFSGKRLPALLGLVLIIASLSVAIVYASKYHNTQEKLKHLSSLPTVSSSQQLVNRIGKIAVLPTGESPTIATVTNINKLRSQAFFANAKNGDKVLIYTKAQEAFLYRPSINKIVYIAPLNLNNSNGTGTTKTNK